MNLLYPNHLTADTDESFRKDAAALETLTSLGIGAILTADEKDLFRILTADPEVIRYRQAEFADLSAIPTLHETLRKLREYIGQLRELSRKRTALGQTTEDVLYSFGEVSLFIDMVNDITNELSVIGTPSSEGFRTLFSSVSGIASDPSFIEITEFVGKLQKSIQNARSVTLGMNLDATFSVYEAGVVSLNDDYYTNGGLFTTVFGKKGSGSDLKVFAPLISPEASASFESAIYSVLNSTVSRSFTKARTKLLSYIRDVISALYTIYDDLAFLLTGYDFLAQLKEKRVKVCLPTLGAAAISAKKLMNPALLKKLKPHEITANDILPHDDVTIRLITGPNSGGKSVFLKSVGIAAVLASLGLPIPAESFELPEINAIYCHFPAKDSASDSRLVEECKAMKEILDSADGSTLLLMDETFSGTNSTEGAVIACEVLKTLQSKRTVVFFSTHLHDITAKLDEFNEKAPHILPLSAEYADSRRTYRIIEGISDRSSHAMEIARLYGLEFGG